MHLHRNPYAWVVCRSSVGTLAAQNNNPYTTPNVVYVPGTGGRSAPAGYYPPAPAPGPVVALGPLGAQAQVAAQNTSFGETQLSGVGPIYKKQDSLEPVCFLSPCVNLQNLTFLIQDVGTQGELVQHICSKDIVMSRPQPLAAVVAWRMYKIFGSCSASPNAVAWLAAITLESTCSSWPGFPHIGLECCTPLLVKGGQRSLKHLCCRSSLPTCTASQCQLAALTQTSSSPLRS